MSRIDEDNLIQFENYARSHEYSGRAYDEFENSSMNINAVRAARTANEAQRRISSVDSSHIPQSEKRRTHPKDFGGEIDFEATKRKNRTRQNKHYKSRHRYDWKKIALTFGLATALTFSGVHGIKTAVDAVKDARAFSTLSVDTNAQNGYEVNVSPETLIKIQQIEQAIQNARNSTTPPTYEELSAIRAGLDDTYDFVVSDLVTKAFEEANPNCEVKEVETKYDKTTNMYTSPNSEPHPENFITITYTDENGADKTVTVTEFKSIALTPNLIEESFEKEYDLDYNHPNSEAGSNFEEIANNKSAFLDFSEETLNHLKQLAGTDIVYKDGLFTSPSVKTVLPQKTTNVEHDNSEHNDDDGR